MSRLTRAALEQENTELRETIAEVYDRLGEFLENSDELDSETDEEDEEE